MFNFNFLILEAEIDAVLATAQAVREATRKMNDSELPPPTAMLTRPNTMMAGLPTENTFVNNGFNSAQHSTVCLFKSYSLFSIYK